MKRLMTQILLITLMTSVTAWAQSSSLLFQPVGRSHVGSGQAVGSYQQPVGTGGFDAVSPDDETPASTRAIERISLVAVERRKPRKFKVNDLISIIVRQQKRYSADAEFEKEKKWNIDGKLSEWFRFFDDHNLGSALLDQGQPGFKFDLKDKYEAEGESERGDKFETRIQARIIDVKPNGNLVLEASKEEKHDEEMSVVTLTGACRSEDVTPANTVMSTQIADLRIVENNKGAVKDATTRGWIPRVLDWVKPF